jgi:hypothetical protein
MDTEGARALARRIADGHAGNGNAGSSDPARPRQDRSRQIFGLHIYRTITTPVVLSGRRALIRQRVHERLVAGRWVRLVLDERLDYES